MSHQSCGKITSASTFHFMCLWNHHFSYLPNSPVMDRFGWVSTSIICRQTSLTNFTGNPSLKISFSYIFVKITWSHKTFTRPKMTHLLGKAPVVLLHWILCFLWMSRNGKMMRDHSASLLFQRSDRIKWFHQTILLNNSIKCFR